MSGSTLHRISVHFPLRPVRMWAVGAPSAVSIDTKPHKYPARDVPDVVAALMRVLAGDAVITVH